MRNDEDGREELYGDEDDKEDTNNTAHKNTKKTNTNGEQETTCKTEGIDTPEDDDKRKREC